MLEDRLRQKLNQEADGAPRVESIDRSVVKRAKRGIAMMLSLGALSCVAIVGGLMLISSSGITSESDHPVLPAERPEPDVSGHAGNFRFTNIEVERPDPKFFGTRTLHVSFDYDWQDKGSTPSNEMCTVEAEDSDGDVLVSQQGAFLVEEGMTSGSSHFRVSVPPGINPEEVVSASLRCSPWQGPEVGRPVQPAEDQPSSNARQIATTTSAPQPPNAADAAIAALRITYEVGLGDAEGTYFDYERASTSNGAWIVALTPYDCTASFPQGRCERIAPTGSVEFDMEPRSSTWRIAKVRGPVTPGQQRALVAARAPRHEQSLSRSYGPVNVGGMEGDRLIRTSSFWLGPISENVVYYAECRVEVVDSDGTVVHVEDSFKMLSPQVEGARDTHSILSLDASAPSGDARVRCGQFIAEPAAP